MNAQTARAAEQRQRRMASAGQERVLADVRDERGRQVAAYGDNADLADGTGPDTRWLLPFTGTPACRIEVALRSDYLDYEDETGKPTWLHLVREEVAEAFQEDDPERLREELIQVAALCVSWCEQLDSRRQVDGC